MDSLVGYNPDDPVQHGFLAALALGESGANGGLFLGTGGSDLSAAKTDQYGFPIWGGKGNSHAAGMYQFQPGTWDSIAKQFNLNFGSASDQSQGAWMLAQQVYNQKTGGSLENALQSGDYSSVQSALKSTWTSVTGSGANPQGLASKLGEFISGASSAQTAGNGNTPKVNTFLDKTLGVATSSLGSYLGDQLSRVGLIVVGVVIIGAAVWALLASQGVAPTPREIVKAV
jgi:hypothetical protein